MILVLGKVRSHRAPNLGYRGAESPGWFDVLPKSSAGDVMREWMRCCDKAVNHQLPRAAAFWITWIVSVEECLSLMQNLIQIRCSTRSVILNVMATQYTCSLNGVYLLHWLVKLSFTCIHSSPLSLAASLHHVTQTILIVLMMARLFLDILVCPSIYRYKKVYLMGPLYKKHQEVKGLERSSP